MCVSFAYPRTRIGTRDDLVLIVESGLLAGLRSELAVNHSRFPVPLSNLIAHNVYEPTPDWGIFICCLFFKPIVGIALKSKAKKGRKEGKISQLCYRFCLLLGKSNSLWSIRLNLWFGLVWILVEMGFPAQLRNRC